MLKLVLRTKLVMRICTVGVVTTAIWISACATNPDNTDATVSFSADIQPILNTYCFRCHREGGVADQAGIAFRAGEEESYDLLVDQPSVLDAQSTLVVPGDAAASLLFDMVASDSPVFSSRMPLGGPFLTGAKIERIRVWIDQGAINN